MAALNKKYRVWVVGIEAQEIADACNKAASEGYRLSAATQVGGRTTLVFEHLP